MRFFPRLLSCFAVLASLGFLFPCPAWSAPHDATDGRITIARVFTGWRDAASFKRISEYFSGQENTGGAIVLRTHADQRAGFYFLVRAANPGATVAVKINLQLIAPTDSKPRTYAFSTELKPGANVLNLGLTAGDWPDAKANPVAWQIDFLATDGHLLTSEKSYLWEKPGAK